MDNMLVGCASRLVADQALKSDSSPIFDFKRTLSDRVIDTVGPKRVRENEEHAGHSGSTYRVGAVVLDRKLAKPVAFVEAVADHNAVGRFREFYDLMNNPARMGVERVAVYDDTKADINSSDILLLQDVSNPVRSKDSAKRFAQIGPVQRAIRNPNPTSSRKPLGPPSDEDEARWDERLRKVAKPTPEEKTRAD